MRHNFKYYCKDYENIENYEKAKAVNFKGWCIHHRLETHTSDGERRLVDISAAELIALGIYYNRPASELIFLTESEHSSLHKPSEETKKKMYKAKKGKYLGENNSFYGKHHSEESKKKMSEANKGNKYHLGKHWFNNGEVNKLCYECPDGFVPGKLLINKGGNK